MTEDLKTETKRDRVRRLLLTPMAELGFRFPKAVSAEDGQRKLDRIGELARAGQAPSWHLPEKTRVVSCEWRTTKHGTFAQTESAGMLSYVSLGKLREVEVKYCPITNQNRPGDAAALRREDLAWWGALLELRDSFRIYGGLTSYVVT
ncbi:hypothetical protein [Pseudooceanicola spongiae]|uniref:Uncharacterized protein n=1 Tax=Pseudooceanicola spongiae TaxID=2613965 RepID=A0A7L9WJX0_9RHOB|nr:hypothetical protein [Pseudooceanicola spongiae]QOL79666.1 hypothetical protein F3W81_01795 [Pseudooceanicola spongiae]